MPSIGNMLAVMVEPLNRSGSSRVRERQTAPGYGRDVGEHACARLPVLHIAIRHVPAVDAVGLVCRVQPDQAIGLAKRQRADGDGVDDAEDRAVHADAEGQAEDGQRREPGVLDQRPKGVAQILEKCVHHGP